MFVFVCCLGVCPAAFISAFSSYFMHFVHFFRIFAWGGVNPGQYSHDLEEKFMHTP